MRSREMNIKFNREEYVALLVIASLAEWVVFSQAMDPQSKEKLANLDIMMQKIYSLAEEFQVQNLVEFDDEVKEYVTTEEFEGVTGVQQMIDDFEDIAFWNRLAELLSFRDAYEAMPGKKMRDIMEPQHENLLEAMQESYHEEFAKFGVDRLRISDVGSTVSSRGNK